MQRKEQRDFNYYKPLRNAYKKANQQIKEGAAKQTLGKRKFVEANLSYKKIQKIDDLIKSSSGDTVTFHQKGTKVTLSKVKASEFVKQQKVQFANTFQEGVSNQFQGAAQVAIGHSIKSTTKQVGIQLTAAPMALASGMSGSLGDVLVNFDQYDSVGDALMSAGKSTILNTTVHATKSIALAGVKGAVKELAPSLAKKIPGLSTIDAVYQLGSSLQDVTSVGDAAGKLANTSVNMGIGYASSYIGAAIGQAVIPIPIAGAIMGSFVGGLMASGTIRIKDKIIENINNS